jgi:hypothetical protein
MDVEKSLDERISDRKGSRPAANRAPRPSRPASNATPYAVRIEAFSSDIWGRSADIRHLPRSDRLLDLPTEPGLTTCTISEEADLLEALDSGLVLPRAGRRGC